MSDNAPVDLRPMHELETLVRHLADELAGFRRRALLAEARLKEIEGLEGGAVNLDLANRVSMLERENDKLQAKLETAGTRAKAMLDRVRFLRQQAQGADR
jgi:hypothetical protein